MTYEDWQRARQAALTAPTGNLALIGYQPVAERMDAVEGLPAQAALAPDRSGILLTAVAADGVTVDGARVDGTVRVDRLRSDGTPLVRWRERSFDVFSVDGTDFELRLYDARAPRLAAFDHVEYYPESPDLVVAGTYRAHPRPADVPWTFTRASDTGRAKHVPGLLEVSVAGVRATLLGFLDGEHLVLVFADRTTGAETYAPGRFLRFPAPAAAGAVTLDFNRSFIPPCGFSDFYSCPIPPPQNRIAAPVRGGERRVVWR